jgi:hypothetical protein
MFGIFSGKKLKRLGNYRILPLRNPKKPNCFLRIRRERSSGSENNMTLLTDFFIKEKPFEPASQGCKKKG